MSKNCGTCANTCVHPFFIQKGANCNKWKARPQVSPDNGAIYFEDYSGDVMRTWPNLATEKEDLSNAALGLAGEAGEVADLIKKMLYQGHPYDHEKLLEELGDVFYYMTVIMTKQKITLSEVIDYNVEKRAQRYPTGFEAEKSVNRGR